MKRSIIAGVGALAAASLVLAGCSSSSDEGGSDNADGGTTELAEDEEVTISLAGWSLATTPEFQVLADAFHEANPNITVELTEYDAENYDTQMIADLAAGSAPDLYVLKNLLNFYTYQSGEQLADVTEVASTLGEGASGVDAYVVDGVNYAVPYRQDSWYLYYNVDLFEEAGVDLPDGSWTWEDYDAAAVELTEAFDAEGVDAKGTYQHAWQSTLQGFANAQVDGADVLSGDYQYLIPWYERVVALQDAGAQENYGTITTNSLTYQSQFGTQKSAMMLMGSWYVATLLAQQESGDADEFAWGIAPAPQMDSSTVDMPVTFGDPTGIGLNPATSGSEAAAAMAFLEFVGSEEASIALAEIGITPAYSSEEVTEVYFAQDGMATDELSMFTFGNHDTKPENPVAPNTQALQTLLGDAHSAILSGSSSPADAISQAESLAQNEMG